MTESQATADARPCVAVLAHLSEWSGAPAAAVRFAGLLQEKGQHRVLMIFPGEGEAARRARDAGLTVIVVPQPEDGIRGGFALMSLWHKVGSALRLSRVLRREHVRVAWIHGMANMWLGLSAWWAGARILWHGHELTVPGSPRSAAIRQWLVGRLAHTVVFAGESSRINWTKNGTLGRVQDGGVLANPLPREVWTRLATTEPQRPFPPGASDPVVILASGLYVRKGADRLLRGVADWGRAAHVILIGEGRSGAAEEAFWQDLNTIMANLPAGVSVELPGAVADVFPHLARAHVFVSLSRSEVAPLLLIEAMAAGVPVIVSDTGEQGPLVGWGDRGLVVKDPGSPRSVARTLQEFVQDAEGQTSIRCQKARAFALGMHDPEEAGAHALRLVNSAMEG